MCNCVLVIAVSPDPYYPRHCISLGPVLSFNSTSEIGVWACFDNVLNCSSSDTQRGNSVIPHLYKSLSMASTCRFVLLTLFRGVPIPLTSIRSIWDISISVFFVRVIICPYAMVDLDCFWSSSMIVLCT